MARKKIVKNRKSKNIDLASRHKDLHNHDLAFMFFVFFALLVSTMYVIAAEDQYPSLTNLPEDYESHEIIDPAPVEVQDDRSWLEKVTDKVIEVYDNWFGDEPVEDPNKYTIVSVVSPEDQTEPTAVSTPTTPKPTTPTITTTTPTITTPKPTTPTVTATPTTTTTKPATSPAVAEPKEEIPVFTPTGIDLDFKILKIDDKTINYDDYSLLKEDEKNLLNEEVQAEPESQIESPPPEILAVQGEQSGLLDLVSQGTYTTIVENWENPEDTAALVDRFKQYPEMLNKDTLIYLTMALGYDPDDPTQIYDIPENKEVITELKQIYKDNLGDGKLPSTDEYFIQAEKEDREELKEVIQDISGRVTTWELQLYLSDLYLLTGSITTIHKNVQELQSKDSLTEEEQKALKVLIEKEEALTKILNIKYRKEIAEEKDTTFKKDKVSDYISSAYQGAILGQYWSSVLGLNDNAWRKMADQFFLHNVLGQVLSGNWEESICHFYIDKPPAGSAYFATDCEFCAFTLGAHVEAQRVHGKLLDEEAGTLTDEYFYKLSLYVKFPKQESGGPQYNDNMDFRVYLYSDDGEKLSLFDPETVQLDEGESFSRVGTGMELFYSQRRYTKVCIDFKDTVTTSSGEDIEKVCNKINEYSGSATGFIGEAGSDSGSSGTTASEGTINTNI